MAGRNQAAFQDRYDALLTAGKTVIHEGNSPREHPPGESHIPPDWIPFTDKYGVGTADDLTSYVNYPGRKGQFDFVLADGRAAALAGVLSGRVIRARPL